MPVSQPGEIEMYIDTDDEIEAPARHDELLSGEVCPGARGAFCIGPLDLA